MLDKDLIIHLNSGKNLLAFSAGVDSTALFFIMLKLDIKFDIAIVDYGLRKQSKEEILYAKELASKYSKKIYTTTAPKISKNFEKEAREFRYKFFNDIISNSNYTNLITAHQLNDKIEWLLMKLSKGAGTSTLSGMQDIESKEQYNLVRPLLNYTKDDLIEFLKKNSIKYFIDSSNFSDIYERNRIRPIADKLLKVGKDGFIRSFKILNQDSKIINNQYKLIKKYKQLRVIELTNKAVLSNAVSKYLKELGYLISYSELQSLKKNQTIVAGRLWAIEVIDNLIYIAPHIKVVIPKKYKEQYRVSKIPPKVRGYFYTENITS